METKGGTATVLLVPSRHIGWDEVRDIVRQHEGTRLAGSAALVGETARLAAVTQPDIVLLGATDMAEAIALVESIKAASPVSKLVLIGGDEHVQNLLRLGRLGLRGCVPWSAADSRTILAALEATKAGLSFTTSQLAETVLGGVELRALRRYGSIPLTDLELAVLFDDLAAGLTERQTAEKEHLSAATLERTIRRLKRKLGARTLFGLGWVAREFSSHTRRGTDSDDTPQSDGF